jgi:hypothetical protein
MIDEAAIRQQMRSAASGETGRQQEFILCYETRQPIAPRDDLKCEVTPPSWNVDGDRKKGFEMAPGGQQRLAGARAWGPGMGTSAHSAKRAKVFERPEIASE